MSVQRQSVSSSKDGDLEITAELPVLDVAAYEAALSDERSSTDTWHMPSLHLQAAAAASPAVIVDDRSAQLEIDLRSLSASLRDVEERLSRKGERLAELERELAAARAERATSEERSAAQIVEMQRRSEQRIAEAETRASELVQTAEERASELVSAAEQRTFAVSTELKEALRQLGDEQTRTVSLQSSVSNFETTVRVHETRDYERAKLLAVRDEQLNNARRDLHELESRAANYLESLQTLEGRRNIFNDQLLGMDGELAARDAQISDLRSKLSAENARARDLTAELTQRTQRVESLEREVTSLAGSLGQRNVEVEQTEKTKTRLQESVSSLTETLGARVERIRALESSVSSTTDQLNERERHIERLIAERDAVSAKISTLENELSSANDALAEKDTALRYASEAHAGLEKRLAAGIERSEALDRDLAVARAEITERAAAILRVEAERDDIIARLEGERDASVKRLEGERDAVAKRLESERDALVKKLEGERDALGKKLESERNALAERLASAEARVADLEQQSEDYSETIQQLQEELRAAASRSTEIEGDLRAAEELLNRQEVELRAKGVKLEELSRTQEEWRDTIVSARQSLAERDSLINRLETEAANSAALLGNIRQGLKRLDPNAESGQHEIAPEGAVRLLIRTDGDTEVVHVLGRKTTVGRTPDNDLQIDAKFISRNHAVILAGPNHTIIEDLNSTNGVAVNNRKISRHTLRDGDSVSIGKTTFRFAVRQTSTRQ